MFVGIAFNTAQKYIDRYQSSGDVFVKKSKGAKRKLSPVQEEILKNVALQNNFATNNQLTSMIEDFPAVCGNTVTNYLKRHGIRCWVAAQKPKLEERDKAIRLELATRNLRRPSSDFERTVYIDEFHIETNAKRKVRVKRLRGCRFDANNLDNYRDKQRKALTAVCCFSSRGLGPIQMYSNGCNARQYLDYLICKAIPYAQEMFPPIEEGQPNFFLLMDNAPIHSSRFVTDYLSEFLPGRLIEHPPYSPDLNPIENLGSML